VCDGGTSAATTTLAAAAAAAAAPAAAAAAASPTAAALAAHIAASRPFDADFLLAGELARGGDGVVYRAQSRTTRALVAAKIISLAKCLAESTAMAACAGHACVTPLLDVRRCAHPRGGAGAALVMPLAAGASGIEYLAAAGALHHERTAASRSPAPSPFAQMAEVEAAVVARQVVTAVAHCHAVGVAHCDVKADNFLVAGVDLVPAPALVLEADASGALAVTRAARAAGAAAFPVRAARGGPAPPAWLPKDYANVWRAAAGGLAAAPLMLPRLQIADFGRAVVGTPGCVKGAPVAGTLQYTAPECAAHTPATTIDLCAMDAWATGIMLAVLLCGGCLPIDAAELRDGSNPFTHETAKQVVKTLIAEWHDPFAMSAPWAAVEAAAAEGRYHRSLADAAASRQYWGEMVAAASEYASAAGVTGLTVRSVTADAPPDAIDLVFLHLLVADPAARAPLASVTSHPWFARVLGPHVLPPLPPAAATAAVCAGAGADLRAATSDSGCTTRDASPLEDADCDATVAPCTTPTACSMLSSCSATMASVYGSGGAAGGV